MPLTSAVFRFASFHVFVFFVWNLRSNLLCHSVSHLLIFHILQTVFCCVSCISTHCFVHSSFVVALPPPLALPHTLRCFVTQHSVSDLYVIASLSAPTPARMLLPYASLWQVSVSVCEFVPQLLGDRVIGRYTPLLRLLLALLVFVQHAATANNPSVQGVQGCCIAGLHCLRCQRGRSSQVSISVVVLQPHFIAPSGCNYFNFVWQHVH